MKHIKVCLFYLLILLAAEVSSSPVGAVFIPQNQFDDVEFLITTGLLDSAGITYYVFSETSDTCFGATGFNTLPFTSLDSVSRYPMDFLILNGGIGISYTVDNNTLQDVIIKADSLKIPIVASNFAPILFMKSGILKGREINFVRNSTTQELVEKYNIKYKSEPIVISENLITSPSASYVRYYIKELIWRLDENARSKGE
ncbi:MAG: DJ-1/PfpI family protein [bacterium]